MVVAMLYVSMSILFPMLRVKRCIGTRDNKKDVSPDILAYKTNVTTFLGRPLLRRNVYPTPDKTF